MESVSKPFLYRSSWGPSGCQQRAREVWLVRAAWLVRGAWLVFAYLLLSAPAANGQAGAPAAQDPLSLPAGAWVQAATDRQIHVIEEEGSFPLSYRTRKMDDKGDTTREVIESQQGTVARLVERDGRLLTRGEDSEERSRLGDILSHPDAFRKHQKRNEAVRAYSTELVRLFPRSMLSRYAAGQPQIGQGRGPQIVIDFDPNPAFNPPSLVAELLTGLQGRLWIDMRTHTLVRVEGHVIHTVNFGWGVLARIHAGGTVIFEQTQVGSDRWAYSHLDDHLRMREVMVHTTEQNVRMSAWNFRLLPTPISVEDAVKSLLARSVPLQP